MKLFITGATGFIGRHLCRKLHEQGHDIVVLLRSPKKANLLPEGVEFLKGDLSSFKNKDFVIPACDVVIHLAAIIAGNKRADYINNNYHSVVDVVECIQRQSWTPKKFLFASSLAAGGPSKIDKPITETMPDQPIDAYGESKMMADNYLKEWNIPTISFRPTIVIGPEDSATFTLYQMGQKGLAMRPAGTPQQLSMVYVEDLVDAIVLMVDMEMGDKLHDTFYVSAPGLFTVEDWFAEIGNAVGKNVTVLKIPRVFLKGLSVSMTALANIIPFTNQLDEKQYTQMTVESFACSGQKLMDELGWKPKHDLESGTKAAVDGYRKAGWL